MPSGRGGWPGTRCPRLRCQVMFFFKILLGSTMWDRVSLVRQIDFFLSIFWKSTRRGKRIRNARKKSVPSFIHVSPLEPMLWYKTMPHGNMRAGDLNRILKHALPHPLLTTIPLGTYSKPSLMRTLYATLQSLKYIGGFSPP